MEKPRKSLADFAAIAISPVLIMALVGSLVFFLLDILYVGRYQASLQWILFCFVFGAVLVARISMEAGISDRAGIYGLVLALVTWVALLRFVDYPADTPQASSGWAINLVLIAIIWWCAHRLTWDCTLIDDDVDASGTGLLETAGLEKPGAEGNAASLASQENAKKISEPSAFIGWLRRYDQYRERRRKEPHAPGVWVVYFSLAALPLFGLGQARIPPSEAARRLYAFQLMCIYVGSGLGLLLTTSFLGLRRYLRQRALRMPPSITLAWLSLGAVLIALVIGGGALVPRPADPHPVLRWLAAASKDRKASAHAQVGEGKDRRPDEEASQTRRSDHQKAGEAKGGTSSTKGKSSDKREKNSAASKEKSDSKANRKDAKQQQDEADSNRKKATGKDKEEKSTRDKRVDEPKSESKTNERSPASAPGFLAQVSSILKWVVGAILVLLVLFFVLRGGLRFLANFTDWARRLLNAIQSWWQGLGALWQRPQIGDADNSARESLVPPPPFSSFHDPFVHGTAEGMSNGALIRYSFEALEAWTRERGLERHNQETPLEFAKRLGDEVPPLENDCCRLAAFYAGLAYSRGNPPVSCREPVRAFWQCLATASGRQPVRASR